MVARGKLAVSRPGLIKPFLQYANVTSLALVVVMLLVVFAGLRSGRKRGRWRGAAVFVPYIVFFGRESRREYR